MIAFDSVRDNLDIDSNVTKESDLHSEKQSASKTSIDEGRMISIKPVPTNVCTSIRDNFDSDSNVIEESDPQQKKQLEPKTTIDEGRMISIKPV
jgi:hypothetical protein